MTEQELDQIQSIYEEADDLIDMVLHMQLDYQDYLTLKNATNAMDELIGEVKKSIERNTNYNNYKDIKKPEGPPPRILYEGFFGDKWL